jgi:hypothetical protein
MITSCFLACPHFSFRERDVPFFFFFFLSLY